MIRTDNVQKYFGNVHAVKDVSFEIGKGEIVGFLGQNGAGKTTLMRLLTTYLPPTAGRIEINGWDADKRSLQVRRSIGYLPENPPLYPQMPVKDYLKFAGQLKQIPSKTLPKEIDRVASECQLREVLEVPIHQLSKGYKQRIGIAQAIIHNPPILILDEPTSGLDPVQIRQVREVIRGVNQERTILLSTHILSEIEHFADRILLMDAGRIIADTPLADIQKEYGSLEKAFFAKVGS